MKISPARRLGITETTFYRWKAKYGGLEVSDAKRLRVLEDENRRLKTLVADLTLDNGKPELIRVDNGTEFTSRVVDSWTFHQGIKLDFIRPGKPVENAHIESFNAKFRDECLNENWFMSLDNARRKIEAHRVDYNEVRPHSSLDNKTPKEFARSSTGLTQSAV